MKITPQGLDLIKRFEGCELEAYRDIAGVWTIGYGHTGPDVEPGMRISERDAEDLLRRDLKSRESAVERFVRSSLNQNEFDALVSFVYNIGAEAFRKSTALKRLNRGDRMGAGEALTWWNKATVNGKLVEVRGLTRRRAAEKAMFLTDPDWREAQALLSAAVKRAPSDHNHRESNVRPAKQSRPLASWLPWPLRSVTP